MSAEQESTSGIIIEWISQISSTAYFLTPLIPIINVYKNKLSIKKIPPIPFNNNNLKLSSMVNLWFNT